VKQKNTKNLLHNILWKQFFQFGRRRMGNWNIKLQNVTLYRFNCFLERYSLYKLISLLYLLSVYTSLHSLICIYFLVVYLTTLPVAETIWYWRGYERKLSWPNLRFYLCLDWLRKTMKLSITTASLQTEYEAGRLVRLSFTTSCTLKKCST
jgi:hypothetical protein